MNLPIASRVEVYVAKISLHATIVIASSLLLLIGYAFNPGRPGGPTRSEAHVGPNNPPIAVNDGPYTVHDHLVLPQIMTNDSDPDGDTFTFDSFGTMPAHGFPIIGDPPGIINFVVGQTPGYVGPDSFTYRLHDSHGALSNYATISINIVNEAPVAVHDEYVIRGTQPQLLAPAVMANDFDPDTGDHLSFDLILQPPAHGSLIGGTPGNFAYMPQAGFEGVDTFTYQITDHLGLRSAPGTVTIYVVDNAERLGPCHKRTPIQGPRVIGRPVDVTTGNMYVQQTDYAIPGAGYFINLPRTYNSQSKLTGLFGKGWSVPYEKSLQLFGADFVRLNEGDGRATYFKRTTGTNVFTPLETDFHGQLTQTASGYTLSLKEGGIHQFNSTGRLLSLTDRNGNQTTLAYNLSGKLSSVVDPFGRVLSFLFNASGRVISTADTIGIVADYTYGGSGELLTVTYADNSGYQFAYDGNLRMTTVSDKLGNVLESHAYDSQGRATTSETQGGVEHYGLSYVSATETDVTDGLGHLTKYFFDSTKSRNVVTRIEGSCGCGGSGSEVRTWTYDGNLNVTQSTDGLGHPTDYTYDSAGNVLTLTNATGTVTYTYNSFGQVLTRTDQMSGVTTNSYSATGNLLTSKDALNNTTTFTYDSRGQVLTVTDARNKTTTLTWDATGRVSQVKDALNNATDFGYNLRAQVTGVTNALSNSMTYEYDAAGRLKKVIYPDTAFVQFTYDLAGRQTKVRDPRGNETNFGYDGAYRLTSVTDALNHSNTFGYDVMSNLTSVTDALLRVTNFEYDNFNRLKKTIYPAAYLGAARLQTTVTYDAAGNVTKHTDTAGRDTTYAYDSANRLTGVTNPALQTTQYQYNARSQRTAVTDALSQQYSFLYDPLGRMTQSTRASSTMSYTYDAVGNLTQRTDYNGAITTNSYDDLNRLSTVNFPDSTTATYGYDVLSRLTSATNQNGTVSFSYDSRNRLTSTTDVWGQTVGYSYDANSNRTGMTLAGSPYASYQYDAVNRLTTLTDSLSQSFTYSYDAADRLSTRLAPSGVSTNFTYDDLDRLFELSHTKSPATLSTNQYGYSDANNMTSWLGSSGNRSFSYDAADRLVSVLKMGGSESYGYDAVGNRTSSHLSASYSYSGFNKLTASASATYTYDNDGQLLTKVDGAGTRTLTWDGVNRLKQVAVPGGPTVTYKYDALGRRIQRTTSAGADERYVYDGSDVLADLNSSSGVTTTYLNGLGVDDHLRQTSTATGVSYFLTDHSGTTSALTDGSGSVVETLAYDSFGNNGGSTRTRYTYTGRERDPDTGLLYYRARFYDPQLGRFISEDPIGFAGGDVNLYGYVWQNPLTARDSSGLDGDDDWTPGGWADWAQRRLEAIRKSVTGLNPDAVDFNTIANFGFNNAEGMLDMARVGRGFGNYWYGTPCTVPADELFADVGRASGIILTLAGAAKGVMNRLAAPPPEPPPFVFRGGTAGEKNLFPRPSDNGMLSTRDSLSNPWPLEPGQQPPLPLGKPIQVIETSRLPPGTVIRDGVPYGPQPAGHVSIGPNVPAQTVQQAIVTTIPKQ